MYLESLGEIIAVRGLSIAEGQDSRRVEVFLGKPQPFPDTTSYYCPFQIVGFGDEEIKYATGIDAIQSLQLVMVIIGATLQYLNEKNGGHLRWEGDNAGGFGFPGGV